MMLVWYINVYLWARGCIMVRLSPRRRQVALHVVEQHALAARYLRSVLKGLPDVRSHSDAPAPLPSGGAVALVAVVDEATLAVPLGALLRDMRLEHPEASVIVLNEQCSRQRHMELLFLGVTGFVAYDDVEDHLPLAIRCVADGGLWMPADAVEEFGRQRLLLGARGYRGSLTRREAEVLGFLQRGFCNKEIASALRVSVSTVKFHLTNIFAKTGLHDRLRAAQWGTRRVIPEPSPAGAKPR